MNSAFRIARGLLSKIHTDLSRPHAHAHERVGFIAARTARVPGGVVLLAEDYLPVADEDYEVSYQVGAMMSSAAIRKALQHAYQHRVSMLHVHRHDHRGEPAWSAVDLRESAKFIPDFWKVCPGAPHGAVLLSKDRMCGLCWDPQARQPEPMSELSVVGLPLGIFGRWWS